ncbi:hypothetical protein OROMI_004701 [Orobanche minor]
MGGRSASLTTIAVATDYYAEDETSTRKKHEPTTTSVFSCFPPITKILPLFDKDNNEARPKDANLCNGECLDYEDLEIAVGNGVVGKNSIGLGSETDARTFEDSDNRDVRIEDFTYDAGNEAHPKDANLCNGECLDYEDLEIAVGNGVVVGKNSIGLGSETDARTFEDSDNRDVRIEDFTYDAGNEAHPKDANLCNGECLDYEDLEIVVGNGVVVGKDSIGLGSETDARTFEDSDNRDVRIEDYTYDAGNE